MGARLIADLCLGTCLGLMAASFVVFLLVLAECVCARVAQVGGRCSSSVVSSPGDDVIETHPVAAWGALDDQQLARYLTVNGQDS